MGLKELLFEQDPNVQEMNNENIDTSDLDYLSAEETVDANAPDVDENKIDIISESYVQNGLEDRTKSIFKVEDILSTLPNELPTEQKKVSARGTLGIFGLSPEIVIEDGKTRCQVLASVFAQVENQLNTSIENSEAAIEEHKKAIAELQNEIATNNEQLKIYRSDVDGEVERITKLVDFIKEERGDDVG